MKEYIFYVLLIFIPIWFLMVKTLQNYGLPKRNIACIVAISLAIIITFPISMTRLGALLAFSVYAVILFLLILYMVKLDNVAFTEPNQNTALPETTILKDKKIKIEEQEELLSESLINKEEVKKEFTEEVLTQNIEKIEEEKSEENKLTFILETTEEDEEKVIREHTKQLEKELSLEIMEAGMEQPIVIEDKADEEDKTIIVEESRVITEDESEAIVEEPKVIKEELEAIAGELEAIVEELENKTEEPSQKTTEQKQMNNEELDLKAHIESAFKYKEEGKTEQAIAQLLLLWENSNSFDLRYLVTLELVELYNLSGQYSYTQELLTSFFAEIPPNKTQESNEIKRQLLYVISIQKETSRLGLEKLPIAELPRWVKIKVADELNQLD